MKIGLTRIVLLSPQRRVDLAIPEYLPLVNLQSTLLRHAGVGLADEGISHHGWVLRKVDGTVLDSAKSLSAQGILDGETVLLAPQDQQWPEPQYDDLSDAVANEAKVLGATWEGKHTRRTGFLITTVALVAGLVFALRSGPGWTVAGLSLTIAALAVLGSAAFAARIRKDFGIAMVLSAAAYAYMAPGVVLLVTGEASLGPPQLLVGAATLICTAVLTLIALGSRREIHIAVLSFGLLGGLGGLLAMVLNPVAAAAIVGALLLLISPWLSRISAYQAGMPAPTVPRPSTETPVDEPLPSPPEISALVRRSDELLTGLLWGMCVSLLGSVVVLSSRVDISARILAGLIVIVLALRGRAFAALRHRLPLYFAAVAGGPLMLLMIWDGIDAASRVQLIVPALCIALLLAVGAFTAGRTYAVKEPSPQLGRFGDITEFTLIAASGVLAAAVTGLFGYFRGLGG